ncbi:hypothetical protein D9M68_184800 [compost metagenome]
MYPNLITEEQRAQLLANGHSGYAGDLLPVVRLFTPDAHATWLLAALDPADGDTPYGLCDVGIGMPFATCTSRQRDRYRPMRNWSSSTVRSPTDRTSWPALLCRPESPQTIVSYDRPRSAEPSRTL